jgi:hypothetical protein
LQHFGRLRLRVSTQALGKKRERSCVVCVCVCACVRVRNGVVDARWSVRDIRVCRRRWKCGHPRIGGPPWRCQSPSCRCARPPSAGDFLAAATSDIAIYENGPTAADLQVSVNDAVAV